MDTRAYPSFWSEHADSWKFHKILLVAEDMSPNHTVMLQLHWLIAIFFFPGGDK